MLLGSSSARPRAWPVVFILASMLAAAASPSQALVADNNSGDWIAAPPGTTILGAYYVHGSRTSVNIEGVGTIKDGTKLQSDIGVVKAPHFFEIGGFTAAVVPILPFGSLHDGELGGTRLGHAAGIADPRVSLPVWIVNNPEKEQYLTVVPFLFFPVGTYDKAKALNLGENRWKGLLQIGFNQGLGNGFAIDGTLEGAFYGNNNEAGTGHAVLSQKNSYSGQTYLRYNINPITHVSLGYSKMTGGEQRINGVKTGFRTSYDQVTAEFGHFISPSVHFLVQAGHDLSVRGGFKQDNFMLTRLLKVF